jgi:sec-independent protein translocase protein TatB
MPQIGWFEILVIVVLSIVIVGPKDFPIMLKKIGNWIGSLKRYFSEVQDSINKNAEELEDSVTFDKISNKEKKKKDE